MKPGYKTSEFAATAFVVASIVITELSKQNILPIKYGALAASVATGLYAIGRGLAKLGKPGA